MLDTENSHVQSLQEEITNLTERNSSSERGALAYAESKIHNLEQDLNQLKGEMSQQ